MTRTDGERRAYQRGYGTGRAGQWPRELVSGIPDDRVRELAAAAVDLEGRIDAWMAGFDDRETTPEMVAIDDARARVRAAVAGLPGLPAEPAPRKHGPGLCPKAAHVGMFGGHLHSETDDAPFDVDGVSYCGRCHWALP